MDEAEAQEPIEEIRVGDSHDEYGDQVDEEQVALDAARADQEQESEGDHEMVEIEGVEGDEAAQDEGVPAEDEDQEEAPLYIEEVVQEDDGDEQADEQ